MLRPGVATKACGHSCPAGTGSGVHSHVPPTTGGRRSATVRWPYRRNQWGGGLARRDTTTSVVGAILAVVPAAITAIMVFVGILGPVTTVAVMGRARRRGRRWLGRWVRNVGVERRRGNWRPGTVHVNLLL
jgi:hypothetical protein